MSGIDTLKSIAELDLDEVRSRFPGLANGWTFFDNAGGTQILEDAVHRMNDFLFNMNVQIGGSYAVSQRAAAALLQGREAMAEFVNAARPEEIAFAPSTTVALQNLARSMRSQLSDGDEMVVTVSDHESNIGPWLGLQSAGVGIKTWAPDRDTLELNLDDLAALLNERTKLVAITQVSNILGTINPIAEITRLAHDHDALVCVDAVAYAPHRAIDVAAWDVDFLALSLYKVFGPHFAVLFGKYELMAELDNLYHYFYSKDKVPAKLEPGNASYELAYSATAIVDYVQGLGRLGDERKSHRRCIEDAFARITLHENALAERLLEYLRNHKACRIIGLAEGDDPHRVPTISFVAAGHDPEQIAKRMDAFNIAIRYGDFHARRLIEYLELDRVNGVVRVSMTHYNTLAEVDQLVDALDQVLS